MISKVGLENVRGVTGEVELAQRTIMVGPNGSGKSAVVTAIQFCTLGYVPGFKVSDTAANASDSRMAAAVTIGTHTIERSLERGKTLRERIRIDGGKEADRKTAEPIFELIFKGGVPVIDMPAFWASTDTEKRRRILEMIASRDELDAIVESEKKARDAKNSATATRQASEKAVAKLIGDLEQLGNPVGNSTEIMAQIKAARHDLDEVKARVNQGQSNDRVRASLQGQIKAIETAANDLITAADAVVTAKAELKKVAAASGEHLKLEPESPSGEDFPLPTWAFCEMYAFSEINEDENEAAKLIDELLDRNEEILSAGKKYDEAIAGWSKVKATLDSDMTAAANALSRAESRAREMTEIVARGNEAKASIESIGPGPDENDVAAMAGLSQRIDDLEKRLRPVQRIEALTASIEKARIDSDVLIREEEQAKKSLADVIERQAVIVREAGEMLSHRSKDVLPDGELAMEDDGRNIVVCWSRADGREVQRTALSGGEKVLFDAALGHTLAPNAIVILEAAEVDDATTRDIMVSLNECSFQVIMATCHDPIEHEEQLPDGWSRLDFPIVSEK